MCGPIIGSADRFSFNRKKSKESEAGCEKMTGGEMAAIDGGAFGGAGSAGDVNFMYGRSADAQRSLGYYYEDEDEYDMKTMYINDGYEPGQ